MCKSTYLSTVLIFTIYKNSKRIILTSILNISKCRLLFIVSWSKIMSKFYLPSNGGNTAFILFSDDLILHFQLYLLPHCSVKLAPRRVFLQELVFVVGQAAQGHDSKDEACQSTPHGDMLDNSLIVHFDLSEFSCNGESDTSC